MGSLVGFVSEKSDELIEIGIINKINNNMIYVFYNGKELPFNVSELIMIKCSNCQYNS